jgi:hypothetical protein
MNTRQFVLVSKDPRVTDSDLATIARALRYQLARHVAPAWERSPWLVCHQNPALTIADDAIIFSLVNNDTATPDALGWHTEDETGKVFGEILISPVLDNGGTIIEGSNSVSSVVSHETIETFLDAAVSTWDQAADGNLYAHEGCDAVEGDSYVAQGVAVSNFLLPPFFDSQAPKGSKFDFLGNLTAPFTMSPGGYQAVMSGGTVTQVFDAHMPLWKRKAKAQSFRQQRRAARVARATVAP